MKIIISYQISIENPEPLFTDINNHCTAFFFRGNLYIVNRLSSGSRKISKLFFFSSYSLWLKEIKPEGYFSYITLFCVVKSRSRVSSWMLLVFPHNSSIALPYATSCPWKLKIEEKNCRKEGRSGIQRRTLLLVYVCTSLD